VFRLSSLGSARKSKRVGCPRRGEKKKKHRKLRGSQSIAKIDRRQEKRKPLEPYLKPRIIGGAGRPRSRGREGIEMKRRAGRSVLGGAIVGEWACSWKGAN